MVNIGNWLIGLKDPDWEALKASEEWDDGIQECWEWDDENGHHTVYLDEE